MSILPISFRVASVELGQWHDYPSANEVIVKNMGRHPLTHWGWVTHICISNLTIIVSDYGLSLGWRKTIIQTNVGILLIWPLGTKFSEIWIAIHIFSFKKMHLNMPSAKCRPFCLGHNVSSVCQELMVLLDISLNLTSYWAYYCPNSNEATLKDKNQERFCRTLII